MGKFTEFKVPLKALTKGAHDFSYRLGKTFFTNMESPDVRDADILVTLKVTYNGDIYDLDFHVEGMLTLQCDRCLDDLEWPVDTTYDIAVKYGDDYNDDNDNLLEIPWADNDLNVAYIIYDTVSLAIPIKHVHPLGKCNRAMTTMLKKHRARPLDDEDAELEDRLIDEMDSMDDNAEQTPSVDPRWNALKDLASNADADE